MDSLTVTLVVCAVLIFLAGVVTGMILLRWELKRNGWRLYLRVDDKSQEFRKDLA